MVTGLGVQPDRVLEQSAHELKHPGFRKDGVVSDSQFVVWLLTRQSPYVLCLRLRLGIDLVVITLFEFCNWDPPKCLWP